MLNISRSDLVAAVAGAGTMGRGIAQVLAQCGVRTLLFDAQPGAAQRGLDSIAQACARLAEKGRLKNPQEIVGRIEVVPGLQAFAPCHVVIEAIVEDLAAKRVLFAELERIVGDEWGWEHIEAGEENAPSHVRALLAGPQVLIPLRDGRLALGTWQGIFFCEFDGPRTRQVYVTPLQ